MSAPCRTACGHCRFFSSDPAALEAAFAGLSSLSSAYAAVRDADGLCAVHERYVAAASHCAAFAALDTTPPRSLSPECVA